MSTANAIQMFFIVYLLRRKKAPVVLRRELEGLGGCAHPQALGAASGADHRGVDGRDGTHVGIGRNSHERRVDPVWEAVILPPGPRAVDGRRDVATWARRAGNLGRARPAALTTDEEQNNDEGQNNNYGLHILLYKHNFP